MLGNARRSWYRRNLANFLAWSIVERHAVSTTSAPHQSSQDRP
jgi:hypothetical protein